MKQFIDVSQRPDKKDRIKGLGRTVVYSLGIRHEKMMGMTLSTQAVVTMRPLVRVYADTAPWRIGSSQPYFVRSTEMEP